MPTSNDVEYPYRGTDVDRVALRLQQRSYQQ